MKGKNDFLRIGIFDSGERFFKWRYSRGAAACVHWTARKSAGKMVRPLPGVCSAVCSSRVGASQEGCPALGRLTSCGDSSLFLGCAVCDVGW